MSRRIWVIAAVVLVLLALSGVAWAQTSPGYDLRWHVLSAGGREGMSAGSYQVHGTLGQVAIGPAQGSAYHLCAGYWCGIGRTIVEQFKLYMPILFKIGL
jgi:hypothetical protein